MKINSKIILVVIFLFSISNSGISQSNEIKVKFIGNCGLHLTDGNMNLYVDFPYKSGAHKYMKYDDSELDSINDSSLFLFTHRHSDHYSKKLVKRVKKAQKGKVYGNWNTDELDELNKMINDFSLQAIKTSHKFTINHYSYLITWHNIKIYISGDTGNLDEISKVKNIDWAFVNPWLFMNAQREKIIIDAKMFGIYHLYPNQKIEEGFSDNIHFLTDQNEIISIQY